MKRRKFLAGGIGADLDEKAAAKYPYQPKTRDTLRAPDGAFVDR